MSAARYSVKKKYDNKKALLTVELDEKRRAAAKKLDKAAEVIIERIIDD